MLWGVLSMEAEMTS